MSSNPTEKHRETARDYSIALDMATITDRTEAKVWLASINTPETEDRVLWAQFLATQPSAKQINIAASIALEERKRAFTAGRADAIAQAGEVLDNLSAAYSQDMTRYPEDSGNREIAMRQSMAVDHAQRIVRRLASSSGSYEARIRREIAEKMKALTRYDTNEHGDGIGPHQRGVLLRRADVLASINGGEK